LALKRASVSEALSSFLFAHFPNHLKYIRLQIVEAKVEIPANLGTQQRTKPWLRLGLTIGGALAIGSLLMVASDYIEATHDKIRPLVLELGIGFVVGGVIAFTIEYYMRSRKELEDKKRDEQLQSNVFRALFGTALSPELVHEVYQNIFTRKFARQNLEIAITLRPLTDEEQATYNVPALLVLTQTVTYDAKNISDDVADYHVHPQEYILISHPMFLQPFHTFTASCGSNLKSLNKPDIAKCVHLSEDGIWHKLAVPEISVPEGGVVHVISKVEMVCRDTDIKTWLTYHPADRLKLKVELDKALLGQFEFAVDQSHRLPLNVVPSDTPRVYEWKLEKPILPYQGIILYWRRKNRL